MSHYFENDNNLLIDTKEHLKENGKLILVIHKEQGAISLIKDMKEYYNIEILDKSKGFMIISLS